MGEGTRRSKAREQRVCGGASLYRETSPVYREAGDVYREACSVYREAYSVYREAGHVYREAVRRAGRRWSGCNHEAPDFKHAIGPRSDAPQLPVIAGIAVGPPSAITNV